jgi:hypothetical protein
MNGSHVIARRPSLPLLTTTRRGRAVVAGSLLLVGAGLVVGPTGAVAAPTLPAVAVVITSIVNTTQPVAIPPTPGAPVALLAAGDQFTLTATLVDSKGGAVAFSNSQETTVTLSATGASWAPGLGTPNPTRVIPAKGTTATFTGVSLVLPTDDVELTVKATAPDAALALKTDSTPQFDLLNGSIKQVLIDNHSEGLRVSQEGLGQPCKVGDGSLGSDPQTCAELVAPNGVRSNAVFTTATCQSTTSCATTGDDTLLQVLADVPPTPAGSRTPAATIIVTCDKTLCSHGGVTSFVVQASLAGGGALDAAQACKKKGLLNSSASACLDYVQSSRDNAGDVHLFLQIPFDARTSCC